MIYDAGKNLKIKIAVKICAPLIVLIANISSLVISSIIMAVLWLGVTIERGVYMLFNYRTDATNVIPFLTAFILTPVIIVLLYLLYNFLVNKLFGVSILYELCVQQYIYCSVIIIMHGLLRSFGGFSGFLFFMAAAVFVIYLILCIIYYRRKHKFKVRGGNHDI